MCYKQMLLEKGTYAKARKKQTKLNKQ